MILTDWTTFLHLNFVRFCLWYETGAWHRVGLLISMKCSKAISNLLLKVEHIKWWNIKVKMGVNFIISSKTWNVRQDLNGCDFTHVHSRFLDFVAGKSMLSLKFKVHFWLLKFSISFCLSLQFCSPSRFYKVSFYRNF